MLVKEERVRGVRSPQMTVKVIPMQDFVKKWWGESTRECSLEGNSSFSQLCEVEWGELLEEVEEVEPEKVAELESDEDDTNQLEISN